MRLYDNLELARDHAHPGQFIMVNATDTQWAVMSFLERDNSLKQPKPVWTTLERIRPRHDVMNEINTDWCDL